MLTKTEIWEKVNELQGKTIYTITKFEPNHILSIENTGENSDSIIIENRITQPTKEDIIKAYELLYEKKELERGRDLSWLEHPNRKISSIVFKIISEIAKDEISIINSKPVVLKLKSI